MEPKSFGQKLGIGVRVASRIAKEHIDAHTQPPAPQPVESWPESKPPAAAPVAQTQPTADEPAGQRSRAEEISRQAADKLRQTTQAAAQTAKQQAPVVAAKATGVRVGAKRFGQALWGPFAHVSSVLWSEVTGLFFGLFTFYFARGVFQYRYAYASGADHRKFLLDLAMTLLFGYFTVSSFYIARRKEKKKKKR